MTNSYRWAWFALACAAVLLWVVLNRWHVQRCGSEAFGDEEYTRLTCYMVDRWTGHAELRLVHVSNPPPERDRPNPTPHLSPEVPTDSGMAPPVRRDSAGNFQWP